MFALPALGPETVVFSLPHNGHCLTQAEAGACVEGLATSCSYPPFFSLQALGNR